jgi:hypothetical protein
VLRPGKLADAQELVESDSDPTGLRKRLLKIEQRIRAEQRSD